MNRSASTYLPSLKSWSALRSALQRQSSEDAPSERKRTHAAASPLWIFGSHAIDTLAQTMEEFTKAALVPPRKGSFLSISQRAKVSAEKIG